MSDQSFSEGILYGGCLEGIDLTGRPDLTGAAITMPSIQSGITAISANSIMRATSWVFRGVNEEPVLTITAEGELIFRDATEAAQALKEAWERLR